MKTNRVIICFILWIVPTLAQNDSIFVENNLEYINLLNNSNHYYVFYRPQLIKELRLAKKEVHPIKDRIYNLKWTLGKTGYESHKKPPLNEGKILTEILFGTAFGVVGGISSLLLSKGTNYDGISKNDGVFVAFIVGHTIGSAIGVYLAGNRGNESGSFKASFLGSVLGELVSIILFKKSDGLLLLYPSGQFMLLSLPPIGATIGFNMTRRYEVSGRSKVDGY